MRRQIQVVVLLLAAACPSEKKAEGPPYSLTRNAERVEVKAGAGYHMNDEYPVTFAPEDGGRLQLKEQATLTETSLSVPVPNVAGTFAFSVCSKDACLIEKVALKPAP